MIPEYMDIIQLRKEFGYTTRQLSALLGGDPTASWINQVEKQIIKDPGYTKIKKIYEFFENLEKEKGDAVGKIASKIISFKIGDNLKKIHNSMKIRGISQVLIKENNKPIGMLSTRKIFKLQSLGDFEIYLREENVEPLPPKIQYDEPINKVRGLFEHWGFIVIEKDGDITHILTIDDMNELGFVKN
jgi:predicted transcriptional regulator